MRCSSLAGVLEGELCGMKGEMPEPGSYKQSVIDDAIARREKMGRTSVTELRELLHGWRWRGQLRLDTLSCTGMSRKGGIQDVRRLYFQEQMTMMQLTSYQTRSA